MSRDLFKSLPSSPLSLGQPKKGRRLNLHIPEKARSEHMHVVGATGSGKSRFLLSLIQQDIIEGRGLCLIDPHGELYDHVVDWLSNRDGLFKDRKIRLINPSDLDWCFGFNPLHVSEPYAMPTVVDATATGLSHVMGGENIQHTPLLNETLRAICYALASAKLTLNEAQYLYAYDHHDIRRNILSHLTNDIARTDWQIYEAKRAKDYNEYFSAAARRIRPFIQNDLMRRIFGQQRSVIDFKKSMDDGEVLLFNLSRVKGKLTFEDQQILGRLIINNLVARAFERDPREADSFYLYIDEVQNFLSGDVPEILSSLRKYGLHLVCAHQYLQQLRGAGDLVYHGVMGTANNKIVFKLNYSEDAAIMADRVFAGHFDFKRTKDKKPVVVGHRVRQLRSRNVQSSQTQTNSDTRTHIRAYSSTEGHSHGESSGRSDGEGSGSAVVLPDMDARDIDMLRMTNTMSSFSGENWASMSGSSFASGESFAEGQNISQSSAETTGSGETYAQSLEPILRWEPSNYYTLEEQKQLFQDVLIKLKNRQGFAVISGQDSVPFTTHTVNDEYISQTHLSNLVLEQYEDSACHQNRELVEEEIRNRKLSLNSGLIPDMLEDDFLQ